MYFSDEKAPEKRFKKTLWLEPAWGVHQVSGKNNAREDWKLTDPDEVNAKSDGCQAYAGMFYLSSCLNKLLYHHVSFAPLIVHKKIESGLVFCYLWKQWTKVYII